MSIDLRTTFILACSMLIFGSVSAEQPLPNQRAVLEEDPFGTSALRHWSAQSPTTRDMYDRFTPDKSVFAGAETWKIPVRDSDLQRGALAAFAAAGMQNPKIIAFAQGNPVAMDVLDNHPDANMASVFVEGTIEGAIARGVALNVFGSSADEVPTSATVPSMKPG